MPKFSLDLDNVAKCFDKRSIKLSDVKHKIEKVAFDVFRFKDGNPEELWQVHAAEDGSEYIVALYDVEEKIATASKNDWSVVVKNDNLHVFYKNDHLCKIAATQLGFQESDLNLARRYLPAKLAGNKNLVQLLFKSIEAETARTLLSKYPELA